MSQLRASEEGAASVEVAFAIGAFLLIFLGVVEFAIDMWIWNSMTLAVQQGGRAAMVYCQNPNNQGSCGSPCSAALKSYVQSAVNLPANASLQPLSCTAASSPVPLMTITATYTVGSISVPSVNMAGLIPGMTLTTQATVPLN